MLYLISDAKVQNKFELTKEKNIFNIYLTFPWIDTPSRGKRPEPVESLSAII
jgi:hypothetical protein